MPKLQEKRLDQMIENAISYKQENTFLVPLRKRFMNWFNIPVASGLTIATFLVIALMFFSDATIEESNYAEEIYEMVAIEIMEDLNI